VAARGTRIEHQGGVATMPVAFPGSGAPIDCSSRGMLVPEVSGLTGAMNSSCRVRCCGSERRHRKDRNVGSDAGVTVEWRCRRFNRACAGCPPGPFIALLSKPTRVSSVNRSRRWPSRYRLLRLPRESSGPRRLLTVHESKHELHETDYLGIGNSRFERVCCRAG
jgi:hypothetical protein